MGRAGSRSRKGEPIGLYSRKIMKEIAAGLISHSVLTVQLTCQVAFIETWEDSSVPRPPRSLSMCKHVYTAWPWFGFPGDGQLRLTVLSLTSYIAVIGGTLLYWADAGFPPPCVHAVLTLMLILPQVLELWLFTAF